eukprot:12516342-Ditylum_brightwellii.AAC.1
MTYGLKDGGHHNCKLCIMEESPAFCLCYRVDNVFKCTTLYKNGGIVRSMVVIERVGMCSK